MCLLILLYTFLILMDISRHRTEIIMASSLFVILVAMATETINFLKLALFHQISLYNCITSYFITFQFLRREEYISEPFEFWIFRKYKLYKWRYSHFTQSTKDLKTLVCDLSKWGKWMVLEVITCKLILLDTAITFIGTAYHR